jgi:inactivated superfamily I helicase
MSRAPILVIPWSADFIAALAERLAGPLSGGDLSGLRLVFPHNRPARHLRAALAAHPALPKPALLPRMQSLDEFLRDLRRELDPRPLVRAGRLDRIGLLFGVVRGLADAGGPLKALGASAREFYPWGSRLATLLEELSGQDARPASLGGIEGEVTPWAAALLGQLDAIAEGYAAGLDARGWTTPGADIQWLARHAEELAHALPEERFVFAGQNALSGGEERILRQLWELGRAEFCWHSDPALANAGDVAWAAQEHRRWRERWRARVELFDPAEAAAQAMPQARRFYEGFDLHSQLSVLERELAQLPDTDSTAIVLPDSGALIPVMHHLPGDCEVNISMGYPLARSSLAQLLETVLVLHENGDGAGRHHWRDMVALVRHPLLRMLRPEGAEESGQTPLKSAYVAWERHIRAGGAMQSPGQWAFAYDADDCDAPEEAVRALHQEVVRACFDNFAGMTTLRQAGNAVEALCELLRRRGGDAWRRHLIDAECLLRLWQSVVPELTGSILADEPYDQGLVFLVLRSLLEAERVSFEPEPLAGMQILGMLETRLITFKRLFILDATEDKLPGANPPDPLLPEPLRQALGLPGRRERDSVAAHNFHRLLMGAREVAVFYQAGVRPGALEGKSERSRYVEQMLWEHEQRTEALVKPRPLDDPGAVLRAVSFPARPILPRQPAIAATDAIRARLTQRLADKGVTPSHLEVWLTCPKKAFFAQALGLKPLQAAAEDGDQARLGELVHRVLKDFLAGHVGKPLRPELLDPADLVRRFDAALTDESLGLDLPYDARAALRETGRERLTRFLEHLPPTTVLALEQSASTGLCLAAPGATLLDISLHGRIDRVDGRPGSRMDGRLVLDYKTGMVKSGGAEAWLDNGLFDRMEQASPGSPEASELLAELAESGMDVQLPLYLHLLAADGLGLPENAAWVELQNCGEEKYLFAEDVPEEARTEVIEHRAPLLARFVLEHALAAPELAARTGRHCQWCEFKGPCQA